MRRTEIKVFLASPSDVAEERKLAFAVLAQVNRDPFLRKEGITIIPVAWDNPEERAVLTANRPPQDDIILQFGKPSDSDIVIVILHRRMGTPLDGRYGRREDQTYLTGTEWEFEDAIRGTNARRGPVVLLYRCTREVSFDPVAKDFADHFAQFSSVQKFFQRCTEASGPILRSVNPFQKLDELKTQLEYDLKATIVRFLTDQREDTDAPRSNHNLPGQSYGRLLGRDDDMTRVMDGLESRFPLIAIEGPPGVGKTSLAIEAGYLALGEGARGELPRVRFDDTVWVSAEQRPGKLRRLNELLALVARVLGFPSLIVRPRDLEPRVNALLRDRRVLIIIDNFDPTIDQEITTWMERVPGPSKVLLTTRTTNLQRAWSVPLEGLGESAAIEFVRQESQAVGLSEIEGMPDAKLKLLVQATRGNPNALALAVGQATEDGLDDVIGALRKVKAADGSDDGDSILRSLHGRSWALLKEPSRRLLSTVPLFSNIRSISADALRASSGLREDEFATAVKELIDFKLLAMDAEKTRYVVHPTTSLFAAGKLASKTEAEARQRWSNYFLRFVEQHAKRDKPAERYWNALVSNRMTAIDREWPSIRAVLKWAARHRNSPMIAVKVKAVHKKARERRSSPQREAQYRLLLDMVMLLVHYLDSRFRNLDRIRFVKRAIVAARRLNLPQDEAILRIDALGWTFVEEKSFDRAFAMIECGMKFAREAPMDATAREELTVIGLVWQARVKLQQGQNQEAERLIEGALKMRCRPVVKFRVHLVNGDLCLERKKPENALAAYQAAVKCSNQYGGEGGGYQTAPRLGWAYLARGNTVAAEGEFESLLKGTAVPVTGKLYAKYGLALVAAQRGHHERAKQLAQAARTELSRLTSSNILLDLIDRLFKDPS